MQRGVLCFVAGTRIKTPLGERPVERLRPGDPVLTIDGGAAPLRWIGRQRVMAIDAFAPIEISRGTLGAQRPLRVSPQHRLLVTGPDVQLIAGARQGLVAATHLLGRAGLRRCPGGTVTYLHLMFDRHEIIWANGVLAESFFVGEAGLDAMPPPMRTEFQSLFPEYGVLPGSFGPTARPCLHRSEAVLLRDA